jgi:biopolymer transport protein ExbD
MITSSDIMIHGKVIASIDAILTEDATATGLLTASLQSASPAVTEKGTEIRREATIMGDREIPYRILKKVMARCTEAGFARISLAVLQKSLEET